MEKIAHFEGTMPTGFPVLWFPRGVMEAGSVPHVAFVTRGWSRGVCDLSILPGQDGAVEFRDQVYHAGDERLRDSFGRLSPGAHARGCWIPVPWMPLPASDEGKTTKKVATR